LPALGSQRACALLISAECDCQVLFFNAMVQVTFVKTLWAVTDLMGNTPEDKGYSRLFRRIAAEGFSAVETPIWLIVDKNAFCAALEEHGLAYVAMINTCTPAGDNNGSRKLEHHLASFERQVRLACKSHAGTPRTHTCAHKHARMVSSQRLPCRSKRRSHCRFGPS
jgi:hypothetical protein